ncbi:MAG TPA: hypothetical protein VEG84_09920 [Thermoanaerobaculia bacterium]|nr:hypothetical protein [Thermoanaerobaculia bacterium]
MQRILLFSASTLAAAALLASEGTAGGVRWSLPAGWTVQAPRSMRVATYTIPAASGAETGECGVYYFGKGQGGGVEENIARWSQQFQGTPKPAVTDRTVAGLRVHRVVISGTYLAPAGPMMQSQGSRPNYRLLGAIVEAPEGLVFFKCTGPAATMSAAEKSFDALLASLGKAALSAAAPAGPVEAIAI